MAAGTPQNAAAQLQQANAAARAMILAQALKMTQVIASGTVTAPGANNNVINIVPRSVGLGQKFTVEITASISAGASNILPTNFNVANLCSQIVFNDLQNYTRIQTPGWHLAFLASVKEGKPFGAAVTTDLPIKYGNNLNVAASGAGGIGSGSGICFCPVSIVATSVAVVKMTYEVPLAYSDRDLRGAVYLGVVNSTGLLQLTINPNPVVASTADATNAVFVGAGATTGAISALSYVVYQHWWDQLPQGNRGPILPAQDLSTVYEMKSTTLTGMAANQDFPIPYSNFRDFLSTFLVWDNNGTVAAGTDINYFALQSANFTNIWKIDPFLAALFTRKLIESDFPLPAYYFSSRNKPLSTISYGNLELILNETIAAAAGQQAIVAWEDFGLQNSLTGAGSLAAG